MHRNKLIAKLGRKDRDLLSTLGDEVELVPGTVLYQPNQEEGSVFFPYAGIFALMGGCGSRSGPGLALVGREGMLGMHILLGARDTRMRVFVQTGGQVLRIKASVFGEALENHAEIKRVLLPHVGDVMNQIASVSVGARRHPVVCRLARWLLITRERAESDCFHVTQEVLG